ncbi:isoquinoline 1-oxidoreductase/isoquinoline 1-oxidoreductase beta subunit [Sinobacterium caligoides]|uniref:Isoquinoline 1-oxidoreductase/isoquinoline 1-oxidoreductase beta subunit n=1 Tax=Sinobacterium caligoides TaxID=933926 RepID=A0A3N2DXU1_9GAMM|nr:molybdopterin cofactor-binding domain-containing protein [Sinobacterium caligoides]ROS04651.1 isoquinoline 1-oxidoreductase/isoquinoline 1-oxidoreductase beta subunit [Sinobacterium caligoides]
MRTTRRGLIKSMLVTGTGLSLGVHLTGCGGSSDQYSHGKKGDFLPNAFLSISPSGEVGLQIHRAEMGQGITTGFAQIVGEELDFDPRQIKIEFAGIHPEFQDPDVGLQFTGGSNSVAGNYLLLREAGATARHLLLQAAAKALSADISALSTRDGKVYHETQSLAYGRLVALAAKLPLPDRVPLKPSSTFKYIGQSIGRVDAQQKVDGSAQFGIDVVQQNMLTAVLLRSPSIGGLLIDYDAAEALRVNGVKHVVRVGEAVAVVATGYWPARKAAGLVSANWDESAGKGVSTDVIFVEQQRLLTADEAEVVREEGEPFIGSNTITLTASYRAPHLAHATMEPMNAVADYRDGQVRVWAGNQGPDIARDMVARALELDREQVEIFTCLLGGGFGRRVVPDYMVEAALVSKAVQNPVKLIWSREDDMANDYYRPSHSSRLTAKVSDSGKLSWTHRLVGPSLYRQQLPTSMQAVLPSWAPEAASNSVGAMMASKDPTSIEGAASLPYQFEHIDVSYVEHTPDVPIGFWRSVGHSQNAFVVESFIDEVANKLKQDPLSFRLAHLEAQSKHAKLLQRVQQMSNWGRQPDDVFQGVAVHESFGTVVAEVVNISMAGEKVSVEEVFCIVDCGRAINPDLVVTQMQSAIIFALTAAFYGEITIKDGTIQQSNFHDYPMLRMNEVPTITVEIMPSSAAPTGVGEPGVPPLAPALANALYAATGERHRTLPIRL